jgi:glycosyltransferase involved in cell wall biosynthesis
LRPIKLAPLPVMPLVSVLVTSHNYVKYIRECIKGVVRQSYSRLELVIADDGSTDESADVIAGLASEDSRIRLVVGGNRGMSAALNTAWKVCRGDIICLLDADDTFCPGKLEAVVRAFQSYPQVGYVIHRAFRTDAYGRRRGVLPLFKSPPSGWCADRVLASGGVLADVPPTSNLSFRREIMEKIFPLHEDFRGYGELMIQRLAPLLTNILGLKQALATWRYHGDNDGNSLRLEDWRLEREIRLMEKLWERQKDFLKANAPCAAPALAPITRSEYYCRLRYISARRNSVAVDGVLHSLLLNAPEFHERPLLDRYFWYIAPWLPHCVINHILDISMTQNRGKELISHILRIGS